MSTIYCRQCDQQSELMSINQACKLVGKRRSTIYNWINAGKLHLYQDPSGRVLICRTSLLHPFVKQSATA